MVSAFHTLAYHSDMTVSVCHRWGCHAMDLLLLAAFCLCLCSQLLTDKTMVTWI